VFQAEKERIRYWDHWLLHLIKEHNDRRHKGAYNNGRSFLINYNDKNLLRSLSFQWCGLNWTSMAQKVNRELNFDFILKNLFGIFNYRDEMPPFLPNNQPDVYSLCWVKIYIYLLEQTVWECSEDIFAEMILGNHYGKPHVWHILNGINTFWWGTLTWHGFLITYRK